MPSSPFFTLSRRIAAGASERLLELLSTIPHIQAPARAVALSATYIVVLFSVIVQGGTIGRLVARLSGKAEQRAPKTR